MKAIQIKYIGCTNTKPDRLKAWTNSGIAITECRDTALSVEQQSKQLAKKYIDEQNKNYNWDVELAGFGCLPNGDYVAILNHK